MAGRKRAAPPGLKHSPTYMPYGKPYGRLSYIFSKPHSAMSSLPPLPPVFQAGSKLAPSRWTAVGYHLPGFLKTGASSPSGWHWTAWRSARSDPLPEPSSPTDPEPEKARSSSHPRPASAKVARSGSPPHPDCNRRPDPHSSGTPATGTVLSTI